MSFQRAYVACKNCHVYSKYLTNPHAEPNKTLLRDTSRYAAMEALEECSGLDKILADKALKDCASCDYKIPQIADMIAKKSLV